MLADRTGSHAIRPEPKKWTLRENAPCCRIETTTGGNCMKRQYTHIKILEPEIIKMREAGKTRQEIADAMGLSKEQIKNWVRRYNRESEVTIPKKRGRPRETPPTKQRKVELRIKELEREVALYRSFLQAAGRM